MVCEVLNTNDNSSPYRHQSIVGYEVSRRRYTFPQGIAFVSVTPASHPCLGGCEIGIGSGLEGKT